MSHAFRYSDHKTMVSVCRVIDQFETSFFSCEFVMIFDLSYYVVRCCLCVRNIFVFYYFLLFYYLICLHQFSMKVQQS